MDRVIKFRGKGADWKYGDYHNFHGIPSITQKEDTKLIIYAVKYETVGQFTGFLDAENHEIYEDDFIQSKKQPERILHVMWLNGRWTTFDNGNKEFPLFLLLQVSPLKVIGNVHDNPELLEGGADVD